MVKVGRESPPPGVPVLVPDLLLHLCVRQGLQEWAPDVRLTLATNTNITFGFAEYINIEASSPDS